MMPLDTPAWLGNSESRCAEAEFIALTEFLGLLDETESSANCGAAEVSPMRPLRVGRHAVRWVRHAKSGLPCVPNVG